MTARWEFISAFEPGDVVPEGTIDRIEREGPLFTFVLADGTRSVPMRGDHKYLRVVS